MRYSLILVIIALAVAACARGAPPSTTRAVTPSDDAQAARAMLAIIWAFDDIDQLKALCATKTQEDKNALEAAIHLAEEVNKVYQAVEKRFGPDAAKQLKAQIHKELAIFLRDTKIEVSGNTATVERSSDNRWTLVRMDGKWKYGLSDWVKRSGGGFGEFAAALVSHIDAMDKVVADINSGKATIDDAHNILPTPVRPSDDAQR